MVLTKDFLLSKIMRLCSLNPLLSESSALVPEIAPTDSAPVHVVPETEPKEIVLAEIAPIGTESVDITFPAQVMQPVIPLKPQAVTVTPNEDDFLEEPIKLGHGFCKKKETGEA